MRCAPPEGPRAAGGTLGSRVCRLAPMRVLIGSALVVLVLNLLAGCAQADRSDALPPADTVPRALQDDAPSPDTALPAFDTAHARPAAPVPDAPSGPVSDSSAEMPGAAVPQQEPERLLRGAAARYAEVRSMRAAFSMETRNPLLRETVRSRGDLFQRRPDRILLRFSEPAGDIIVSDGRYIWVWYPSVDSTQVLRTPAAAGAGGVDLLSQFVGDPTERFDWAVRGVEPVDERPAVAIALDPRGDEAYRQLVVWIDRQDFRVRRFEIIEHSGVVRRVELRDLTFDPDLPDSIFRFSPPPGARIVGAP